MKLTQIGTLPEFTSQETTEYWDEFGVTNIPLFSGSQAPCPVINTNTGNLEVWFSARDLNNRSYPFKYVLNDRLEVISTVGPLAELGKPGEFDADGFMVSQIKYSHNGDLSQINYTGWNDGNTKVRYRTACGSKIGNFKHVEIDRNDLAPCGSSMPFEIEIGSNYCTFYMAYKYWQDSEPKYTICYHYFSTSPGDDDQKEAELSLGPIGDLCSARPTVLIKDSRIYLFYSSRSTFDYRKNPENAYRLRVCWLNKKLEQIQDTWIDMELDPLMDAYMYPIDYNGRILAFWNKGGFKSPIAVGELRI